MSNAARYELPYHKQSGLGNFPPKVEQDNTKYSCCCMI